MHSSRYRTWLLFFFLCLLVDGPFITIVDVKPQRPSALSGPSNKGGLLQNIFPSWAGDNSNYSPIGTILAWAPLGASCIGMCEHRRGGDRVIRHPLSIGDECEASPPEIIDVFATISTSIFGRVFCSYWQLLVVHCTKRRTFVSFLRCLKKAHGRVAARGKVRPNTAQSLKERVFFFRT